MIAKRLENLRKLMTKNNIHAYIIPGTDPHMSEYLPDLWKRREWISGFNGSAGDVVVTLKEAGLWTDSRYFLQADIQLKNSGITLFKMGEPTTPDMFLWIKETLNKGESVGIDPKLLTITQKQSILKLFKYKKIKLKEIEENLVDTLWEDQPSLPLHPIEIMEDAFSGENVSSKLERVRKKMVSAGAENLIISTLDSIAWLFNIRSCDISYNPMVISYAIITKTTAKLFINKKKMTDEVRNYLVNVSIYNYEDFKNHLKALIGNVMLDRSSVSSFLITNIQTDGEIIFSENPITLLKSIKNPIEIQGFKNCHIKDGAAMASFLNWLYKSIGKEKITEVSASEKLLDFRKKQDGFVGESFSTIAGYKEHGAIIHYSATKESDVELKADGIFLLDSGGQYTEGTTDITRTVSLGNPTEEEKEMFTLVLKGHIDLAMTSYPEGTAGKQLDTIARKPLWDKGLNYGHGTGHGVGHYSGVHEGPQAISYYRCTGVALVPGMVTSNEPGFYKEGKFGIRTENLIVTVKDSEKSKNGINFYKFENLTLCPIDKNLINKNLLTEDELNYLNNYHKTVFETISPLVDKEVKAWLKKATEKIS